jgi:adenosylcobinamide-phosphate guanylyltransferase
MYAIIMAGGAGSRLGLGEKPLVMIGGNPMISLVLSVFEKTGYDTIVVTSPRTPYTHNWVKMNGYECVRASGNGYIPDLQEALTVIESHGPLFTCVADLPCLSTAHIIEIRASYEVSGKEALSVWVPASCGSKVGAVSYSECISGIEACPAGINMIRGDIIDRPQDEEKILMMDRKLSFNVNTRTDLEKVRHYFSLLQLPEI